MSISFDGVNDYIDCGSSASIDDIFDGGGSIACWVYLGADPADGAAGELVTQGPAAYNAGYVFRIFNDAGATAYDRSLMLRPVFSGGGADWRVNESQTPSSGTWFHTVVTYDADSTANDPLIYINGVSQTVVEVEAPVTGRVSGAASPVNLGGVLTNNPFNGRLEDVRMFTRVLSAQEAAVLAGGFREPLGGEALWVQLNGPDGNLTTGAANVFDMSGNGNHGTPQNGSSYIASYAPRLGRFKQS